MTACVLPDASSSSYLLTQLSPAGILCPLLALSPALLPCSALIAHKHASKHPAVLNFSWLDTENILCASTRDYVSMCEYVNQCVCICECASPRKVDIGPEQDSTGRGQLG